MIYKFDRKYIHHRRILLFIALHWIVIFLIAGACFFFAAAKNYRDTKIKRAVMQEKYPDGYKTVTYKVDALEKSTLQNYVTQKTRLDKQEEYNKKAVFMNIDYRNIPYVTGRFSIKTPLQNFTYDEAVTELIGYMKSNDVMQAISKMMNNKGYDYGASNIRELVTFAKDGQNLVVTVMTPDAEASEELFSSTLLYLSSTVVTKVSEARGKFVLKKLQSYSYTASTLSVRDTQEAYVNRANSFSTQVANILDQIESNPKQYYKKWVDSDVALGEPVSVKEKIDLPVVSKRKAVKKGIRVGAAGLAAAMILFAIMFWCSNKIWSIYDITDSFSIPGLGEWSADRKKKVHKHGRFLWKADSTLKRNSILSDEELKFQLESFLPDKTGELLVISDAFSRDSAFAVSFSEQFSDIASAIKVLSYDDLLKGDCRDILEKAEAIVLMEPTGKTSFSRLEKGLLRIFHFHEKIAGAVVVC